MVFGQTLRRPQLLQKRVTLGLIRIQAEFLFIMMDTGLRQVRPQLDLQAQQVLPAQQEPMVPQVRQVQQVPQDLPVMPEQQVPQALPVKAEVEVWLTHGG
jgi:hypothetical protein